MTKNHDMDLSDIKKKRLDNLDKEIKQLLEQGECIKIKIANKEDERLELQGKHPYSFSDQVFGHKLRKKWEKQ